MECAEHHHQNQKEVDSLTQHPAEGSQEEILEEGCYYNAANLAEKIVVSHIQ